MGWKWQDLKPFSTHFYFQWAGMSVGWPVFPVYETLPPTKNFVKNILKDWIWKKTGHTLAA
jgi:hypothetical protein